MKGRLARSPRAIAEAGLGHRLLDASTSPRQRLARLFRDIRALRDYVVESAPGHQLFRTVIDRPASAMFNDSTASASATPAACRRLRNLALGPGSGLVAAPVACRVAYGLAERADFGPGVTFSVAPCLI